MAEDMGVPASFMLCSAGAYKVAKDIGLDNIGDLMDAKCRDGGHVVVFDDSRWVVRLEQQPEGYPIFVIEFNGWPAGVASGAGGIIAAGELANEETFVAALQEGLADVLKELGFNGT